MAHGYYSDEENRIPWNMGIKPDLLPALQKIVELRLVSSEPSEPPLSLSAVRALVKYLHDNKYDTSNLN